MFRYLKNFLFSSTKKTLVSVFVLLLIISVPLTLRLTGQQQELRQRAAGAPTCTLTANPNPTNYSSDTKNSYKATLTWTSQNAESCKFTITNRDGSDGGGVEVGPLNGYTEEIVYPDISGKQYSLTCTGSDGSQTLCSSPVTIVANSAPQGAGPTPNPACAPGGPTWCKDDAKQIACTSYNVVDCAKCWGGSNVACTPSVSAGDPNTCSNQYFGCSIISNSSCSNSTLSKSNCYDMWVKFLMCSGNSQASAEQQAKDVCKNAPSAPTPTLPSTSSCDNKFCKNGNCTSDPNDPQCFDLMRQFFVCKGSDQTTAQSVAKDMCTVSTAPIPTTTITITPTTVITPPTILSLSIGLPGVGAGGLGKNANPRKTTRNVDIAIFNAQGQQVKTVKEAFVFNNSTSLFSGNINIGSDLASGSYNVKVRFDNTLWRLLPGIQTITKGETSTLPSTTLISGDVVKTGDSSNKLDLNDYNAVLSCIKNSCDLNQKSLADLNDDGNVEEIDLNILYSLFSTRNGD